MSMHTTETYKLFLWEEHFLDGNLLSKKFSYASSPAHACVSRDYVVGVGVHLHMSMYTHVCM